MGVEIPLEIRFRAEEMYVVEGRTYDQVAEASGVSVTQLKRWGADSDWGGMRREYREAQGSILRDTVLLRKKMITQALNTLDPQAVYAVARLEKAAIKKDVVVEVDRPKLFLEDMQFIAKILKEIDPEGLKAFGRNFDAIVMRFKESHAEKA